MEPITLFFMMLVLTILVIGLVMTYRLTKMTQKQRGEYDKQWSEKVLDHPVVLNPIFITYLLFAILTLGFILYSLVIY